MEEWLNVDKNLPTTSYILTEDEIVDMVTKPNKSAAQDSDDDAVPIDQEKINCKDVIKCLKKKSLQKV